MYEVAQVPQRYAHGILGVVCCSFRGFGNLCVCARGALQPMVYAGRRVYEVIDVMDVAANLNAPTVYVNLLGGLKLSS